MRTTINVNFGTRDAFEESKVKRAANGQFGAGGKALQSAGLEHKGEEHGRHTFVGKVSHENVVGKLREAGFKSYGVTETNSLHKHPKHGVVEVYHSPSSGNTRALHVPPTKAEPKKTDPYAFIKPKNKTGSEGNGMRPTPTGRSGK